MAQRGRRPSGGQQHLALSEDFELYREYHDVEWDVPLHDDRALFELLILEDAQTGLSWATILKKREKYRHAFNGFDQLLIARYDDEQVAALLSDSGIVRNRAKVASSIQNVRAYLALTASGHSFSDFLWQLLRVSRFKIDESRWLRCRPGRYSRMR